MLTIGFIGAGNMAKAMMRGWQKVGDELTQVVYSPNSGQTVASELGLQYVSTPEEVVLASDMVVLAMPPSQLSRVAERLRTVMLMKPGVIIASVLGGVSLKQLHNALGSQVSIVRALPNINVALTAGYTALAYDNGTDAELKGAVAGLFLALGRADELPEEQFGAVSALAGSGPAFVAGFVRALTEAGVANGIDADIALTLAKQTVLGTLQNMKEFDKTPQALADEVMTPGGSTAAGWQVLQERGLTAMVGETIAATMKKNAEFEKDE
jgi:pyrroline-5-carboxylate reductase